MMTIGVVVGIIVYYVLNKLVDINEKAKRLIKIETQWKPAILVVILIFIIAIISGIIGHLKLDGFEDAINGFMIGFGVMFVVRIIPKQFKYM
ncbi:MAG: hypothetical protein ACRCWM_03485 [Sarcina sp.]